jgi:lysozyme
MSNLEEAKAICTEFLLVPFESYAVKLPNGDCTAYPDPATKNDPIKQGKPYTIGYGSTYHADGTSVKLGEVWTKEYAIQVKKAVLDKFLIALLVLSPDLISEPPRRIAAVLSLVYNIGLGNYRISKLRKKVNQKDYQAAFEQFFRWNKANGMIMRGLTRRREAEAFMFIAA